MRTTEDIRRNFLAQNAYTDDAFSTPQQTHLKVAQILQRHDTASARLEKGELLETVICA